MNRALWNAGGSPAASVYAEPAAGPAALPAFMVPMHVRQQNKTSHEPEKPRHLRSEGL
jgi:hypothetical protein